MEKEEKGIMIHYITNESAGEYKKQVEKTLPEFKHIYHLTENRVGYDILKVPKSWLTERGIL